MKTVWIIKNNKIIECVELEYCIVPKKANPKGIGVIYPLDKDTKTYSTKKEAEKVLYNAVCCVIDNKIRWCHKILTKNGTCFIPIDAKLTSLELLNGYVQHSVECHFDAVVCIDEDCAESYIRRMR